MNAGRRASTTERYARWNGDTVSKRHERSESMADALDELPRDVGQHLLVHIRHSDKLVRDLLELLRYHRVVGQRAPMRRLILPES